MSDDDIVVQAIADANAAADAAEAAPAQGATEPVDTGGADTPEWQGKFADADTMWKSYQHAQASMTQAQQQRAELERQVAELQATQAPQQEYNPFGLYPPDADALASMAAENPGEAYYYALTHPEQFGWQAQKVQDELFQQWMFQDPRGALRYENQRLLAESQAQHAQEIAPVQEHYLSQMQDAAIQWAMRELPEFDAYAQDVENLLLANPGRFQQILGDRPTPQAMNEVIKEAYVRARYERYDTQRRQPVAPESAAPPPPSTSTQTRSRAAAPDASYDDAIRSLIMNSN